jgi:serine/threonine protein kinase
MVSSPFYIAPEIFTKGYNQATNIWNVGVFLYMPLREIPLFWEEAKAKIFLLVKSS